MGKDLIDLPRKNFYGDFSEAKKKNLHGQGFSLLNDIFEDNINRTDLPILIL